MNSVLYYSNTGESKRIAEYFANETGYRLADLLKTTGYVYENTVVVFPVHCQNVPQAVTSFLSRLQTKNLILIAAYGKMSYGNVLYEIQQKYRHNIVAAAYVPTKHAYVDEPRFEDFVKLAPLFDKFKSPTAVKIPKSSKNPFADFAPAWRSRQGVKLVLSGNCNGCGQCAAVCPEHAIKNGKTNRNCIRCLRCVQTCPQGALSYILRPALAHYLRTKRKTDIVIYA